MICFKKRSLLIPVALRAALAAGDCVGKKNIKSVPSTLKSYANHGFQKLPCSLAPHLHKGQLDEYDEGGNADESGGLADLWIFNEGFLPK